MTSSGRSRAPDATALAGALVRRYGIARDAVTTHRGIDGRLTQCPGKNFPLAKLKDAIFIA